MIFVNRLLNLCVFALFHLRDVDDLVNEIEGLNVDKSASNDGGESGPKSKKVS